MVTRRQPSNRQRDGAKRPPRKRTALRRETNVLLRIVEIGKSIPDEEIAKLPKDSARNLEHYLYGSPKQE